MVKATQTVGIGLLGTTLDAGRSAKRWQRWRPTVALHQHEDLLFDAFELLYDAPFEELAESIREDIQSVSPETQVTLHQIQLQNPWDFEEVYSALYDFTIEFDFDDQADYLIHITTGTHVAQICEFLLTESRHFPARLVQTSPPRPRSDGGPGSFAIIDLDLSRYDHIAQRNATARSKGLSFLKAGIETKNASFNKTIENIERVSIASTAPILLTGPTGAGKSHLARRIYQLKKSRNQLKGPLVEVNCATLRGDHAMSTLFGHKKGAFTGAQKDRAGLLRSADQGLLFLDEIGELGLDEQAMLLRAIEEKTFLPVGSDTEVKSDFQLIAGTNRVLHSSVQAGVFREDLLARIDLWSFALPALRERPEDIEPNVDFELDRNAGRLGTKIQFNKEARKRFLEFAIGPEASWTSNFRDLSASLTRMSTLAHGGRIDESGVRAEIERLKHKWYGPGEHDLVAELLGEESYAIDSFDRVQLNEVIRVCRTSRTLSEAGRTLFAQSRKRRTSKNDADRVRKYLTKWGLSFAQIKNPDL